MFLKMNEKYRKTPLKHELLLKLLQKTYNADSNKSNNIYSEMVHNVKRVIADTHGSLDSQVGLCFFLLIINYND